MKNELLKGKIYVSSVHVFWFCSINICLFRRLINLYTSPIILSRKKFYWKKIFLKAIVIIMLAENLYVCKNCVNTNIYFDTCICLCSLTHSWSHSDTLINYLSGIWFCPLCMEDIDYFHWYSISENYFTINFHTLFA